REGANFELAFGKFADTFAQRIGRTIHFIEAFGPARGHAPPDRGSALGDCGQAGGCQACAGRRSGLGKKATSLHLLLLFVLEYCLSACRQFPGGCGAADSACARPVALVHAGPPSCCGVALRRWYQSAQIVISTLSDLLVC